ncbi:MAG: aspartate/glutamate racemase family protein [Ramlibacter sp.]
MLDTGTEPRIYLPGVSAFPRNRLDMKIQEIGYIEAGLRAARDGCDAIVLNTIGDYGIEALKSAVRVPVVGAGEAGISVVASLGRPFSIVTIWPAVTDFLYAQVLHASGLGASCAKVAFVGSTDELEAVGRSDDDYITRMQQGEQLVFERIVAACRAMVDTHGATAILLGCTCMSPVAAKVSAALDVPVVNPLITAAKHAEMLVRLGLRHSPVQYRAAQVARDAAFAAMAETAAFHVSAQACEACVFTPAS